MYLELQGLNKSFGDRHVVRDLSLTLDKGEILCLLGSSGCGKTTTLKMVGGLLSPDSGRIFINGEEITSLPPERRPVSTVFQSYALFPHMTVLQNVTYGLRLQRMAKKEMHALGMEYLEIAGLADYAHARVTEISGGQQQRVALMRSLILRPKVLLLDEPLSNLDARLRERMRIELRELRDRFDLTMVFVTHDREEAMVIASRVAVMNQGKIIQIGTPEELYQHPADDFVLQFLGDSNRLTEPDGATRTVRPEDLLFHPEGELSGTVLRSDYHGFYRHYLVETPQGVLRVTADKEEQYSVGESVRLRVREPSHQGGMNHAD